ncbi:MAG TPA: xanthine dehydrogenase family protein subunit M [Methylomirabilota bacterium]|jgi:carbon-monoxide dehydrogenase medium subunit|nr:xanthine dehydrogenase family protein subunit M [Methylomirabilota bacterium]
MLLPRFEYRHATSLVQATTLLAENPEARPLAGGTDLLVDLRERRQTPRVLVDIGALPELAGITAADGGLAIGGGVTVGELLASSLVFERAPALRQAAHDFADFLTRNRATLGGNLANASPGADLVIPLLALDARVVLAGPGGERGLSLDGFLRGPRQTALAAGELVRAVVLPVAGGRQFFYKLGLKRGGAIAVVSVATRVELEGDGRCRAAAIALGAVAPRPFRASEAEAALRGHVLTPDRIAHAADLAAAAARPISDVRGGDDYRRAMVRALVARALSLSPPGNG